MSTHGYLSFNGWGCSWDTSRLIGDNMLSITANQKRSGVNGLFLDRGIIQGDCACCLARVLMSFAGCWYSFPLRESERWEDAAFYVGKGQMLRKTVAFGHDNYGG